tara:strand:- start:339 stop:452 length:114 start_codon:yes stop_codon:yes gene_type:complete
MKRSENKKGSFILRFPIKIGFVEALYKELVISMVLIF